MAQANLRGGGEFGPAWERAGRGALGRLKVYEAAGRAQRGRLEGWPGVEGCRVQKRMKKRRDMVME